MKDLISRIQLKLVLYLPKIQKLAALQLELEHQSSPKHFHHEIDPLVLHLLSVIYSLARESNINK